MLFSLIFACQTWRAQNFFNKGADAYVLKPPKMREVLSTLKESLQKQKEEKRLSEEKVAEFIQKRAKEIGEGNLK